MREILDAYSALREQGARRPTRAAAAEMLGCSESTMKRAQGDLGWIGWPPRQPMSDLT